MLFSELLEILLISPVILRLLVLIIVGVELGFGNRCLNEVILLLVQ
jgi:hypothetical protein